MTCLFALRRFHLSYASACVASLLFACTHYHFFRGEEHLFLASYYVVPLSVMVALWVYLGRLAWPLSVLSSARERQQQTDGRRRFWAGAAISLVQASTGVYYAIFACYLLLVAGAAGSLSERKLRPLGFSVLFIAVTMLGGLANMAPTLVYRWQHGRNVEVARRDLSDAEIHSLKIGQMLLPAPGHRFMKWANVRQKYDALPLSAGEKRGCALGAIGAGGFLFLLAALALPRDSGPRPRLVAGLALLNIYSVLLAVNGGFGTLIALLASPQIRGYNRISIFIAMFSLFVVAIVIDGFLTWQAQSGRRNWPAYPLLALAVVLGVADQAGRECVPDYAGLKARFLNDAQFIAAVEAKLRPGEMVFQLPYFPFPEYPPVLGVECYDVARPYLHSSGVHWSYGAMKGRETDLWQRRVQAETVQEMVKEVVSRGFRGICIDRRGYADHGAGLETQLRGILGEKPLESDDRRLSFFSLRPRLR